MQRRNFIKSTTLLAGAILIKKNTFASMIGPYEYQVKMLRNNIGIFTERGGTIGFLLSKDGIIVIDAQFPDTAPHFIEEAKKQSTASFTNLLNTHHHADHTAGNIAFKGIVQQVAAHTNSLANQKAVAEKNKNLDKQLLPDVTFTEEFKLKTSDEKIKGEYYGAGHTNGDAIFHFENANILHVGDLVFNKRHPFVDRSAGANMASWIKVTDKIYHKADKNTLIICGHSLNPGEEVVDREQVKKFGDYLGQVLKFAESEMKKGVTKEEFIKNTSIPGNTEWSGQGIDRPLTAAWEELAEKKA
jgi:cyclase